MSTRPLECGYCGTDHPSAQACPSRPLIIAPVLRWVKWKGAKRHTVDGNSPNTLCGYEIGPDSQVMPDPAQWSGGQVIGGPWFVNNPGRYCGICLRMRGISSYNGRRAG